VAAVTRVLKYFAYGSNLHPLRLNERAPSGRALGVARLAGYALRFHKRGRDGSAKCSIEVVNDGDSWVAGVVYEISTEDKAGLDRAEGVGAGYHSVELGVQSEREHHRVHTYIADPGHVDEILLPFSWYKAYVLHGARFHGLPPAYIEAIERITAVEDPERERALMHFRVLDQLER